MCKKLLLIALVATLCSALYAKDYIVGDKLNNFDSDYYAQIVAIKPCAPDYKNTYEFQVKYYGEYYTWIVQKGTTIRMSRDFRYRDRDVGALLVRDISPNKISLEEK